MKTTVHWLTSDIHNAGTDTELFATETEWLQGLKRVMEDRLIDLAGTAPDEDLKASIQTVRTLLDADKIAEAWAVFQDEGVIHEEDWFYSGEQELEMEVQP